MARYTSHTVAHDNTPTTPTSRTVLDSDRHPTNTMTPTATGTSTIAVSRTVSPTPHTNPTIAAEPSDGART
jgi:hypothetical protein